ncbi:MAG: hypothetical protein IIC25_02525 [Chloroflexi bacterium]|nr:hypothetical protein [Chloroflexota bacterium]
MEHKNFESLIKRRVLRQLFLCRNKVQAAKLGIHPDVRQVWCRGMDGAPFFVHAIHAEGWPRQPHEIDIIALQKMATQNVVGGTGHTSWLDSMDKGASGRYTTAEEDFARRVKTWFAPGGEGYDRAMHMTKNHLVIPVKQSFDSRLHVNLGGRRG